MESPDLEPCASQNRRVFDVALGPYVTAKLKQVVPESSRRTRSGWLDATGCVWCLFDDGDFVRSGDAGRRLLDERGKDCPFCVYWSMGDVVMPAECDARWVAQRIAAESMRQLSELGFVCAMEEREVEGERHLGVRFRKGLLRGRAIL